MPTIGAVSKTSPTACFSAVMTARVARPGASTVAAVLAVTVSVAIVSVSFFCVAHQGPFCVGPTVPPGCGSNTEPSGPGAHTSSLIVSDCTSAEDTTGMAAAAVSVKAPCAVEPVPMLITPIAPAATALTTTVFSAAPVTLLIAAILPVVDAGKSAALAPLLLIQMTSPVIGVSYPVIFELPAARMIQVGPGYSVLSGELTTADDVVAGPWYWLILVWYPNPSICCLSHSAAWSSW